MNNYQKGLILCFELSTKVFLTVLLKNYVSFFVVANISAQYYEPKNYFYIIKLMIERKLG